MVEPGIYADIDVGIFPSFPKENLSPHIKCFLAIRQDEFVELRDSIHPGLVYLLRLWPGVISVYRVNLFCADRNFSYQFSDLFQPVVDETSSAGSAGINLA